MTNQEIYDKVIKEFCALPEVPEIMDEVITATISVDPMDIMEVTENNERHLPSRSERRVEVNFRGTVGQAFTETPREFTGTIREVLERPFEGKGLDCVLVAMINAVMGHYDYIRGTCHCDRDGHESCGSKYRGYVQSLYEGAKIVIVGYQAFILRSLVHGKGTVWTMDRDYNNITKLRHDNVITNSGFENREAAKKWADLFICSGSMVCNGTLEQWIDTGVPTVFYGVTIAGVAKLLNLRRICFAEHNIHINSMRRGL